MAAVVRQVEPGLWARSDLRLEVEVASTTEGFRLGLRATLAGVRGERELTGPGCEALVDSAAVVVAIAMVPALVDEAGDEQGGEAPGRDGEGGATAGLAGNGGGARGQAGGVGREVESRAAVGGEVESRAAGGGQVESRAAGGGQAESRAAGGGQAESRAAVGGQAESRAAVGGQTGSHASGMAIGLGAMGITETGALPEVALGAGLRAELRGSGWSVPVALGWLAPRDASVGALGGMSEFTGGLMTVGGCARLVRGRAEVGACLLAELLAIRGHGVGLAPAKDGWSWAPGVGPSVSGLVHVSQRVSLWAGVAGVFRLRQMVFSGGTVPIYESARTAVRGCLGVEYRVR